MKTVFLSFILFIFTGCSAIVGYEEALSKFNAQVMSATCRYDFVEEKIEDKDDVLLWSEQGGVLARDCYDYNRSNFYFDIAEKLYKSDVDLQSSASKFKDESSTILINSNVNEYQGSIYEKIMLNTYKGLNYISLKDFANARVEFNRALDRQRRAKDYFKKEIKEAKKRTKKDKNFKIVQNPYTQKAIYDRYEWLFEGFESYGDFVNPFATYMSGIFFLIDKDYKKAREILKFSYAMDKNNPQIRSDFELSENFDASKRYVWIIYENGLGMQKREWNLSVPLFLFTNKVYYAGIALPVLKEGRSSYEYLKVNGKKTQLIADMDRVIKAEFKKRLPMIVTKALLNTVVKTYAQYELNKSSDLGGFLGMLYGAMTNKADIRSWSVLPKNFQSLRVEIKDKNIVNIEDDRGNLILMQSIKEGKSAIIYVRSYDRRDVRVHKIEF
jgi:hypothetical protein